MEWTQEPGDSYAVTGTDVHGRRFSLACATWGQARGINVYRGSKWLVRDGRRILLARIFN